MDPVVFVMPISFNGGDPATARVVDVQNNQFSVRVQEVDYKDDFHFQETASYIVLESGTWTLGDGTSLEVGHFSTDQTAWAGFDQVSFNSSFSGDPAVFSQVQTSNDAAFVQTRMTQINQNGFKVALEEEKSSNRTGDHDHEDIGWFAIYQGEGTWDGNDFQAVLTGASYSNQWSGFDFATDFAQAPNLFASLASYNGSDAAGLRYRSLDEDTVQFQIAEEKSHDSEVAHVKESLGILAIEGSGALTATGTFGNNGNVNEGASASGFALGLVGTTLVDNALFGDFA